MDIYRVLLEDCSEEEVLIYDEYIKVIDMIDVNKIYNEYIYNYYINNVNIEDETIKNEFNLYMSNLLK